MDFKPDTWRAYKHWIFDSKNNHVFGLEDLNLSNHSAALIVEEVNKAFAALARRAYEEGISDAAEVARRHEMQFAKPINDLQKFADHWARTIKEKILTLKTPAAEEKA